MVLCVPLTCTRQCNMHRSYMVHLSLVRRIVDFPLSLDLVITMESGINGI